MSQRHIVITQCPDRRMWYAGQVGHTFELVRDLPLEHCYLSREPDGHSNIVRHADALALPAGFAPVDRATRLERHDLVLTSRAWAPPTLEQIGQLTGGRIVIRRSAP